MDDDICDPVLIVHWQQPAARPVRLQRLDLGSDSFLRLLIGGSAWSPPNSAVAWT
jgi:hypothetical protein